MVTRQLSVPLDTLTPHCPPRAAKPGGIPWVGGAEPAQPPSWGCAGIWGMLEAGKGQGMLRPDCRGGQPGEDVDTEGKNKSKPEIAVI